MKKNCEFNILLVFFFTPLEAVPIFEGFSVVKLIIIIFCISCLFNYKNIKKQDTKIIPYILVFTFYSFISFLWSIDKEATYFSVFNTLIPTSILTLLLVLFIQDSVLLRRIFYSYVIGTITLCAFAIYGYQNILESAEFGDQMRLTVFGQDQNELAFLINMGIVYVLFLLRDCNKSTRKYLYISLALFSLVCLATGSRTGFIVLTIIVVIWLFTDGKSKLWLSLFLLPIIILVCYRLIPEEIFNRLFETSEQIQDKNFSDRGAIWMKGLEALNNRQSYFLGTGYNTFFSLLYQEFGAGAATHNTYIQTFIELGFLGFIFFGAFIVFIFKKTISLCRKFSYFFILFILPLLITMLSLGFLYRRWLFLFGVLIFKLVEYNKISKKYK